MKYAYLAISLLLISLSIFAADQIQCAISKTQSCTINSKGIIGETCWCNVSIGSLKGQVISTFSNPDLTRGLIKSMKIAGEYLCSSTKLNDFNFEREYGILFAYSFSNRDVSKIKQMSDQVNKSFKKQCKKDHSLSSWSPQACYETCWKNYPEVKNDVLIREQCLATCTSLKNKTEALVSDVASLIDKELINPDKCETDIRQVDNSSRGNNKPKTESYPINYGSGSGSTISK